MSFSFILVGRENLTRHCLRFLVEQGHQINVLICDCPKMTAWAQAQGVMVLPLAMQHLAPNADWLLSVANLAVLPAQTLAKARLGAVNFHDGPLPQRAGVNVPAWAILAGEVRHGITWHMMEQGVDQGHILHQQWFDIAVDETAASLGRRCFAAAVDSFPALVAQLETGLLVRPNGVIAQRHLSYDRPANHALLDFGGRMADLSRLVRGLNHGVSANPMIRPKIQSDQGVWSVSTLTLCPDLRGQAGQILAKSSQSLVVACGDGAVELSGLVDQVSGLPCLGTDVQAQYLDSVVPADLDHRLLPAVRAERDMIGQLQAMLAQPALDLPACDEGACFLPWPGQADFATYVLVAAALLGWEYLGRAGQGVAGYSANWSVLSLADAASVGDVAHRLNAPFVPWLLDLRARNYGLEHLSLPAVMVAHQGAVPGAKVTLTPQGIYLVQEVADWGRAFLTKVGEQVAKLRSDQGMAALAFDLGWPACDLVHQGFEAQVARSPDSVALVYEGQSWTYQQLNGYANDLAHRLIAKGVGPGHLVGLCVQRSAVMVAAALAILKSGAAYVPMDPGYPPDRIALFVKDSDCILCLCDQASQAVLPEGVAVLLVGADAPRQADIDTQNPDIAVGDQGLAYVIYTSGSTGLPKGVMVEHRNVVNFFAGMDRLLRRSPVSAPGVWLAVTSLSFDISVLELFWTLARGFKVVLVSDAARQLQSPVSDTTGAAAFSLYYWGNEGTQSHDKYHLLLEGARFADTNGFAAVWTPERHFHAFGGAYPNPSVTGAAVAAVTKHIAVRAGSCVLPLHHPLRVAEEWAVIDNLTQGRAGIAVASGWQPDDFVLRPDHAPPLHRQAMWDGVDDLRNLWRGQPVSYPTADGQSRPFLSQPRPISRDLPLWITTAAQSETWIKAGQIGAHILTHLLGQNITDLADKIRLYHQALRENGYDPADFAITVMLHCFIGQDREQVRRQVAGPMKAYLAASIDLVKHYAWSFPAFSRPISGQIQEIDLSELTPSDQEAILEHAFSRYFEDAGLFGTIEDGLARVAQLRAIGVTEFACLIDFGLSDDVVLAALPDLARLKDRANMTNLTTDYGIAAQIRRHNVTHLQATPSLMRMLVMDTDCRAALSGVSTLLVGGEALPDALAGELAQLGVGQLYNMYGPTETTIWSTAEQVFDLNSKKGAVKGSSIGHALFNQQVYILNDDLTPAAPGLVAELWIGGVGVAAGYWKRPDLTKERFVPNPYGPGRIYRTGDLVKLQDDGRLGYIGRADHQLKLRGHRIELGEIEAQLELQPHVTQALVVARQDGPGDVKLVAYYTGTALAQDLRAAMMQNLPAHMLPQQYHPLAAFPLTPNGKVDRSALLGHAPAKPEEAPAIAPEPYGLEDQMRRIWSRILGVDDIQPSDSFFELGGHSLLALELHRTIRQELPGFTATVTDIFRVPVFSRFIDLIKKTAQPVAPVVPSLITSPVPQPDIASEDLLSDLLARRRALYLARRGVKNL